MKFYGIDVQGYLKIRQADLPAYTSGTDNRKFIMDTDGILYYGSDVHNRWVAIRTGDDGDISLSIGSGLTGNGVSVPLSVSISVGSGLTGNGVSVPLSLGTPGDITDTSTNSVTSTSHTHRLSVGSLPSAGTGTAGLVTLYDGLDSSSTSMALTANQGRILNINKVPTNRSIGVGNGLIGGGDLSVNRTLSMGTPGTITDTSTNGFSGSTHTHAVASASEAQKGIVQFATLAETINGANVPKAVTPYNLVQALIDAGVVDTSQSLLQNGYYELFGGLLIQWGVIYKASGNLVVIPFNTPFSQCFSVQTTLVAAGRVDENMSISSVTSTGFTCWSTSPQWIHWFAVGKK